MAKVKKVVKKKAGKSKVKKLKPPVKKFECLFCKIVKGEIPSAKIYEDNNAIAILDISPVAVGHTLIISKKHSESMLETDEAVFEKVMKASKKVSAALMKSLNADGLNTLINTKPAAGQIIPHLHIHIIPRFKNDGQQLFVWKTGRYKEGMAEQIINKIKKEL